MTIKKFKYFKYLNILNIIKIFFGEQKASLTKLKDQKQTEEDIVKMYNSQD